MPKKYSKGMSLMRSSLVIIILLILGVFAKDNVVAELKHFFLQDNSPSKTTIRSIGTIEVAFSPNNGATKSISKALALAKKSILVSAYSFTSDELAQALLDAKRRNVLVKLILDKSQVSQRYSSSTFFANQGFDLRIDVKHAIYHNKVMVIDDNTVITGSFNFTKAAETKNAENVIIIRDNPQLALLYTQNFWFHWQQSLPVAEFLQKKKNQLSSW